MEVSSGRGEGGRGGCYSPCQVFIVATAFVVVVVGVAVVCVRIWRENFPSLNRSNLYYYYFY